MQNVNFGAISVKMPYDLALKALRNNEKGIQWDKTIPGENLDPPFADRLIVAIKKLKPSDPGYEQDQKDSVILTNQHAKSVTIASSSKVHRNDLIEHLTGIAPDTIDFVNLF